MNKIDFTYKSKRETDKELAHINVYANGCNIGYLISEIQNLASTHNWYFAPSDYCLRTYKVPVGEIHGKTKGELIQKVEGIINN